MSTFNLLKEFKLLKKDDFSNLRDKPSFYKSGFFLFFFKKNDLNNSRLGISVSTKVGNAVYRNRIKRHIREIYRQNEFKNNSFDVNVVVNSTILNKKKKIAVKICEVEQHLLKGFNSISNS